ncbi:hypothetical protein BC835DRAFT_237830 [Cytidiella melzeri]|nr:hypothetical protein BC835DRAFT_237830 [Cytidiella melzeri]
MYPLWLIALDVSQCLASSHNWKAHTLRRHEHSDAGEANFVPLPFARSVLARDFEWEPEIASCPSPCSVLEEAFAVCKTSECICTPVVAEGFRSCMACSIQLSQYPGLPPDAHASLDSFIENCEAEGFPLTPQTVSVGDATLAVPSYTPYTGLVNQFSTVNNEPTGTATATIYTSGGVVIISGGGTFGYSAGVGFTTTVGGNAPQTTGAQAGSSSSPTTTLSTPTVEPTSSGAETSESPSIGFSSPTGASNSSAIPANLPSSVMATHTSIFSALLVCWWLLLSLRGSLSI